LFGGCRHEKSLDRYSSITTMCKCGFCKRRFNLGPDCLIRFSIWRPVPGSDQGGANVWIKNTGDISHTFWVSYEVMDRRGKWYTAPPESVYAEPGSDTYFVSPVWSIPDDAEIGSYQADFYLYGYYDPYTGELSDQLDQVAQVSAFSVVG